jgi:hypothetical protein
MTKALMAAAVLVFATASNASAQMFISTGRDTLRALPGVEVAVEPLEPELERAGLTGAAIYADVERKLRAGGITVYASQRENPSEAKPYVSVDVNGVKVTGQEVYAIAVQVQVRQTLRSPVTSSNIVDAMTWDARNVLVIPAGSLSEVSVTIDEYLDQFIQDWMAVHR